MMKITRFRFDAATGLLLAVTLAACGGKDTAPATPTPPPPAEAPAPAADPAPQPDPAAASATITPEDEAMVQRLLAYFDALAQAASAAGGDCDQMAVNINQTAADHDTDAMWAEMAQLEENEAKSQALDEKYGPEVEAKVVPLVEAVTACAENQAVQEAIQAAMPQ
jgi:hypothetical protein